VLRPGGTDTPADAVEDWSLPYDLGATAAARSDIRARIDAGQSPPPTYGNPLYPYGAGIKNWSPPRAGSGARPRSRRGAHSAIRAARPGSGG